MNKDIINKVFLCCIYPNNDVYLFKTLDIDEFLKNVKDSKFNTFDYLAKYPNDFQIIMLDEPSFTRLYTKALETKADKQMSNITQTTQDVAQDQDEDDISDLSSFLKTSADIMTSTESAPIIKFVNSLFYQAIKKKASDIHIEVHEQKGEIRYRVDGILLKHIELDKKIISLVISRIKVISNLDISEKRIPQDGRTQIKIDKKNIDIRVSIAPTYFGEKAVMRILMESEDFPSLKELGFNKEIENKFKDLLEHSYGMILVTGPTGSGKSTTLHSFLQTIASSEKNIITIEDPVEYKANNINQIQVNPKVNLTFATALRSILRQDPDIIMVGEIRDKETAKVAIQAALTGHLMLSTLHTNNAPSTITRLIDMGIEPFLISSSIIGILSQRLIRKLCSCKEEDEIPIITDPLLKDKKIDKIYKPKGCKECNFTGYKGRKAVGELLIVDDDIKKLIAQKATDIEIKNVMIEKGIKTLKEAIFEEVINGVTSMQEAIRVGLKD